MQDYDEWRIFIKIETFSCLELRCIRLGYSTRKGQKTKEKNKVMMPKTKGNRFPRFMAVWYNKKKGKLITSHRYDLLPLLRSSPGGIRRELVV